MKKGLLLLLSACFLTTGCETNQGTGALLGAGLGTGIGAAVGDGEGALIGAVLGTALGSVAGADKDAQERNRKRSSSKQPQGCPSDQELLRKIRNLDFGQFWSWYCKHCAQPISKSTAQYLKENRVHSDTIKKLRSKKPCAN